MNGFDPKEFYAELDKVYETGDHDKVESFLRGAADEPAAVGGDPESEEVSAARQKRLTSLNELAGFLRYQGRFEEAAQAHMDAESILLPMFGKASSEYATLLNNRATTYRMMGDTDAALALFAESMAIYEEVGEQNAYLLAGVLNNLAVLYQSIGKYDEAANAQVSAVEKLESDPELKDELATAKANLAALYHRMNRTDEAKKILSESLALFELLPYESAHAPAAFNTLGTILARDDDIDGAIEAFETAAKNVEAMYTKNMDYGTACMNLGALYEKTGKQEEAIAKYTEAKGVFSRIFGEDNNTVIAVTNAISRLKA